jgi:hypothetical protein
MYGPAASFVRIRELEQAKNLLAWLVVILLVAVMVIFGRIVVGGVPPPYRLGRVSEFIRAATA